MKLNRPGSDCSLNHWIMLLAFQHEPFRWEPLLHDSTNLFTWTLKDRCVSNAQLVTPQEITGFIPLMCPSCLWLIRETRKDPGLFCSAGTVLAAVGMLDQSSELLEGSRWKGSGAQGVVIWRLILIVLIHREVLDFSVPVSHMSFSRSLEMYVTCNMFILFLCLGVFHASAHFPAVDFEILPVLLFGD